MAMIAEQYQQHAPEQLIKQPQVVDAILQAKAQQKFSFVQDFIRSIESAMDNNSQQDRDWLRSICDKKSPCFPTLLQVLLEPKYQGFVSLYCVSLRAMQLILRVAAQFITDPDHGVGMLLLLHLVGEDLTNQVFTEVHRLAVGSEPHVACNALLLLGELGPEALAAKDVRLLLEIILALPDRADDLVEVALRAHAWGGEHRTRLLAETVAHPGGQLLCEVLLQVVNRAEPKRGMRAVKVLGGCLALPDSERLLYTNDARVLVEILHRELPNVAGEEAALLCHAECFKALITRCPAARNHRRDESQRVLGTLASNDRQSAAVRAMCAEIFAIVSDEDDATMAS